MHMLLVYLGNGLFSVDNAQLHFSLALRGFYWIHAWVKGCVYVDFIFNFSNNFSFISLVKAYLALILSWASLRRKILALNYRI